LENHKPKYRAIKNELLSKMAGIAKIDNEELQEADLDLQAMKSLHCLQMNQFTSRLGGQAVK